MPKLRNSWILQIREILDKTRFTAADFAVQLLDPDESDGSFLVVIEFVANEDYGFAVIQFSNRSFRVECRPGRQYEEETFDVETLPLCMEQIPVWCSSIRDELGSGHILDQELESMRTELQGQINEHIRSTSSHFTKEEIDSLRNSLSQMAEELENLKERADESEEIIEEMRTDISGLMDDLESFPKYVWLRTAGNKLLNIAVKASRSKEIRELMIKAASGLMLGPGPDL